MIPAHGLSLDNWSTGVFKIVILKLGGTTTGRNTILKPWYII